MSRRLIGFILCINAMGISVVHAQIPWQEALQGDWHDPRYASALPPFCLGLTPHAPPQLKNVDWKKRYGGDFGFINHYCNARAKRPVCYNYTGKAKKACLLRTMEGADYNIKHAKRPDSYKLMPLLYTDMGYVYYEVGEYGKALEELYKAIKHDKRYLASYVVLADVYLETKEYDKAMAAVEEGLKYGSHRSLLVRKEKIESLLREGGNGKSADEGDSQSSSASPADKVGAE